MILIIIAFTFLPRARNQVSGNWQHISSHVITVCYYYKPDESGEFKAKT